MFSQTDEKGALFMMGTMGNMSGTGEQTSNGEINRAYSYATGNRFGTGRHQI